MLEIAIGHGGITVEHQALQLAVTAEGIPLDFRDIRPGRKGFPARRDHLQHSAVRIVQRSVHHGIGGAAGSHANGHQAVAGIEGLTLDLLQGGRQLHADQPGTLKRHVAQGLQTLGQRNIGQLAAAVKGLIPDHLQRGRQVDLRQSRAVMEHAVADLGDTRFQSHAAQAPAVMEYPGTDLRHRAGDGQGFQTAVIESAFAQSGQALGQGDGRQLPVILEREIADFLQGSGQDHRSQAGHVLQQMIADAGDALTDHDMLRLITVGIPRRDGSILNIRAVAGAGKGQSTVFPIKGPADGIGQRAAAEFLRAADLADTFIEIMMGQQCFGIGVAAAAALITADAVLRAGGRSVLGLLIIMGKGQAFSPGRAAEIAGIGRNTQGIAGGLLGHGAAAVIVGHRHMEAAGLFRIGVPYTQVVDLTCGQIIDNTKIQTVMIVIAAQRIQLCVIKIAVGICIALAGEQIGTAGFRNEGKVVHASLRQVCGSPHAHFQNGTHLSLHGSVGDPGQGTAVLLAHNAAPGTVAHGVVDGGLCLLKGRNINRGGAACKADRFHGITAGQGHGAQIRETCREGDGCQRPAIQKRANTRRGQAVRQIDLRQFAICGQGVFTNGGNPVGQFHRFQIIAHKYVILQLGDSLRDHNGNQAVFHKASLAQIPDGFGNIHGGDAAKMERIVADGGHTLFNDHGLDLTPIVVPGCLGIVIIIVGHVTGTGYGQDTVFIQRPFQIGTTSTSDSSAKNALMSYFVPNVSVFVSLDKMDRCILQRLIAGADSDCIPLRFRSEEVHIRQRSTATEGVSFNSGNAGRKHNACQFSAGHKGIRVDGCNIAQNCDIGQLVANTKCTLPQAGHAGRNGNVGKFRTIHKRGCTDSCDAVRNINPGHQDAAAECDVANGEKTIRQSHIRQHSAIVKRAITNAGHTGADDYLFDLFPIRCPRHIRRGFIVIHLTSAGNGQDTVLGQVPCQIGAAGATGSRRTLSGGKNLRREHTDHHGDGQHQGQKSSHVHNLYLAVTEICRVFPGRKLNIAKSIIGCMSLIVNRTWIDY